MGREVSPLRVGLVAAGEDSAPPGDRPAAAGRPARLRAPLWAREAVERLQASDFARIVLVLAVNEKPCPRPGLAQRLVDWADEAFAGRGSADPLQAVDLGPAVAGCHVMSAGDAAAGAHDLDVVIDLVGADVGAGGGWRARQGVWRCRAGGAAEVLRGAGVTESTLLAGERVIARAWSTTNPVSPRLNRRAAWAKAGAMLAGKLRELHETGEVPALSGESEPESEPVSGSAMVIGAARAGAHWLAEHLSSWRGWDQWILGVGIANGSAAVHFEAIMPPPDRFWADPFPIEVAGQRGWTVFIEEYLRVEGRGHIAVMHVGEDGSWTRPVPVLAAEHHLSYPFVFRWRDDWYMVPESAQSKTVELYRATEFPRKWERVATLLAGMAAVDTTLAEIDGAWWMFTCRAAPGTTLNDELHLYRAESPLGPWQPHPRNPVKSDARGARPAGRLLVRDGAWHRPAQDSASRYGRATVLQRITRLDLKGYAEIEVARIEPEWAPHLLATHTYNEAGSVAMVDGLLYSRDRRLVKTSAPANARWRSAGIGRRRKA